MQSFEQLLHSALQGNPPPLTGVHLKMQDAAHAAAHAAICVVLCVHLFDDDPVPICVELLELFELEPGL